MMSVFCYCCMFVNEYNVFFDHLPQKSISGGKLNIVWVFGRSFLQNISNFTKYLEKTKFYKYRFYPFDDNL